MSVSSETRKAGPFSGNGTTTQFPFTFKVFEATDIEAVSCVLASGIETVLAQDIDYTVTMNADQNMSPGGQITLATALPAGSSLVLTTDIPEVQTTDLLEGGAFYADVINEALDYLTILVQQLNEVLSRTLRLAITDNVPGALLPPAAQRVNSVLYFDATGAPTCLSTNPAGTNLFAGNMAESANGSRTIFTMTKAGVPITGTPLQVTVWCNFPLVPGVGYTLGPGAGQVTFATAPELGDTVWAQGVF